MSFSNIQRITALFELVLIDRSGAAAIYSQVGRIDVSGQRTGDE